MALGTFFSIVSVFSVISHQVLGQADDPNYTRDCHHLHTDTGDIKALGYQTALGLSSVVWLCERRPGSVGAGSGVYSVGFDPYNRIPLIVQTVLEDADINAKNPGRLPAKFIPSELVPAATQANTNDYEKSNSRTPRYEQAAHPGVLTPDPRWAPNGKPAISTVHQGHLVADQYIRDQNLAAKEATYRYSNAVPQFGVFNSGVWSQCETVLMRKWMTSHCVDSKAPPGRYWRLYLMTGVLPSTGKDARWMGRLGFGDTKDMQSGIKYDGQPVKNPQQGDEYHLNVPDIMWTAACCIQLDTHGNIHQYKNTAFGRENIPQRSAICPLKKDRATGLLIQLGVGGNITPFPSLPECTDQSHYIDIKAKSQNSRKTDVQRVDAKRPRLTDVLREDAKRRRLTDVLREDAKKRRRTSVQRGSMHG